MSLPACHHRGEQRADDKVRCSSDRIIHRERGWATAATCLECPFADQPAAASSLPSRPARKPLLECPHRGAELRQESADLCGMHGQTVPILACSLHGECTIGRYCRRQTVRSCVTCIAASENVPRDSL